MRIVEETSGAGHYAETRIWPFGKSPAAGSLSVVYDHEAEAWRIRYDIAFTRPCRPEVVEQFVAAQERALAVVREMEEQEKAP